MSYLIGMDEAGYGPPLGPLVVAGSVWEIDDQHACEPVDLDLYKLLRHCVCSRPSRAGQTPPRRLPIADSKTLYNPAQGIGQLERGVLVALTLLGHTPTTWHEAWEMLCPGGADDHEAAPWHADYEAALPLAALTPEIERMARKLCAGFDRAGIRLRALGGRAIFPVDFNRLVKQYGNKSNALSAITMDLLSDMMAPLAGSRVSVICDKHGGRNHYASIVQHFFSEWLVTVRQEGAQESRYTFGPDVLPTTISFRCRAERAMPVALASMAAKYLRELAMRAFNEYWRRHLPELRPTAGYAQDARRFKRDIAQLQTKLQIEDRILWRSK